MASDSIVGGHLYDCRVAILLRQAQDTDVEES